MNFFDAFPMIVAGGPPFTRAIANLERSIPGHRAEVDRLLAGLHAHPNNTARRAELNDAAQKLARRYKSAADLIALYLHQRLETDSAPDAASAFGLMTYHDEALRDAFAARRIAICCLYEGMDQGVRIAHLRDTYDERLFLGGTVEEGEVGTASLPPHPRAPKTVATHAA